MAEQAPLLPAWDREMDITISIDQIAEEGVNKVQNPPKIATKVSEAVTEAAILKITKTETRNLESHTYAAIISILNYTENQRDPKDEVFRRVLTDIRHSRADPEASQCNVTFITRLPEKVRRRIWGFVISDNPDRSPTPVRLQPFNPFFKDVWKPEGFQGTRELFERVEGSLSACFAMRTEMFAHIFTTHRFHFVFSPFAKEGTCPQMFYWIDQHSQFMENTTVELDLSKLGFGPTPEAGDLLWGDRNIVAGMRRFVDAQTSKRRAPINSIILLARRYHGLRPAHSGEGALRPYCPPEADFSIAGCIVKLRGRVKLLRMAGFNAATTNTILMALFPGIDFRDHANLNKHCSRADVCGIWPFLENQGSVHHQAQYPYPKTLTTPEPSAETERVSTPTSNFSKARKQIDKLKYMLDAYDAKKARGREVSIEMNNEEGKAVEKSTPTPARRNTTRRSGSSKDSKTVRSSSDIERSSPTSNETPKISPVCDLEERESKASTIRTLSLRTEETIEQPKTSTSVCKSTEEDAKSTSEISKRASQISNTSIQSGRSVRWSDDQVDCASASRTDSLKSARSNRAATKTMSMPAYKPNPSESEKSGTLKKRASARELGRKKSFGEFLRGSPRSEVCESPDGSSRRSKTPGPDSSRVLSNLTGINISGGYGGTYL